MTQGEADPLNSQFRLTYNMILNLLRVEGINPEYMLERSFAQFQNYASLPHLYASSHSVLCDKPTRRGCLGWRREEGKGAVRADRGAAADRGGGLLQDQGGDPERLHPFF